MEFTVCTAGKDDEGKRLDRVVRAVMDDRAAPDTNIFQALRKRLIRLNGSKAEPSARVHEGDTIEIAGFLIAGTAGTEDSRQFRTTPPPFPPAPTETPLPAPDTPRSAPSGGTRLEVLFQNDDLLFINKPVGISVQPSRGGAESISRIVRAEWEAAGPHGSLSFIPAPLHRLDRYTSGVLAISRSARGAAWFNRAIQERSIRKLYLGICQGRLIEDELWEDRLTAADENSSGRGIGFYTVQQVEATGDGTGERKASGSLARTRVHPVSYGRRGQEELTLVQYELLTGRKHQIRAQSALHGHPLYGDTAYGGHSGGGRFFLHALRLEFPPDNPCSLPACIEAPLPEEFAKFIGSGWSQDNFSGFSPAEACKSSRLPV